MIARLGAIAALLAGCGRHQPKPAPPLHTRPSPRTAGAAPAPPTADAHPVHGGLTWEGVAIQDDLGVIPNVRLGTVTIASGTDLTALVTRLRTELPALRGCFRRAVTPRPKSQLTLTLSFEIDDQGQVAHAEVHGTDVVPLRQCLAVSLIGKMGFPPGPVEVAASLVVTPVR